MAIAGFDHLFIPVWIFFSQYSVLSLQMLFVPIQTIPSERMCFRCTCTAFLDFAWFRQCDKLLLFRFVFSFALLFLVSILFIWLEFLLVGCFIQSPLCIIFVASYVYVYCCRLCRQYCLFFYAALFLLLNECNNHFLLWQDQFSLKFNLDLIRYARVLPDRCL